MLLRRLLIMLFLLTPLAGLAQEEGEPVGLLWEEQDGKDPWEPMNRKIFAFNEGLDKYLLRPVAKGYRFVTPDPVESGVTNFILNIYEFNTMFNSLLQGRVDNTIHSMGRFFVNTTIGLLGFFDVATQMGVDRRPADFGQTLAVWGFDSGPFIMVPIAGPRTVRSGTGLLVDSYTNIPSLSGETAINWTFLFADAIDTRAQLLKADQLISGDKYIFLREAYLSQRRFFLEGGVVEDDFSDFGEGEDFEEF